MKFQSKFIFLVLSLLSLSLFAQKTIKVVSLTPNTTEMILALNAKSSLVGRSSACNYIPEIENLSIVGDMGAPNMELIVRLKPDAVISSVLKNPSDAKVIENLGIKFYFLPTESFDEYYTTIAKLGNILRKEREAEIEIQRVKDGYNEFAEQAERVKREDKPKIFWEIWYKPFVTIGNKSFLNEFIELAGGVSITSNVNRNYFEIAKESIITSNPDVIIAPGLPVDYADQLKKEPGWNYVRAVRNGWVYTDLDPNLVSVFGPRMLETIQIIHNLIYKKNSAAK